MMNMPPDGFEDSGPPDGFEDQAGSVAPSSIFDRIKSGYQSVKESPIYGATLPGVLDKTQEIVTKGANYLGEKTAEGLARYGVNPNVSAAVGTTIQMAPDIAAAALTMKPSTPKGPGMFETIGARGVNSSMGIRPQTLEVMAKGNNPSSFGTKLGTSLFDEGALTSSAEGNFDKAKGLLDKFGQDVGKALENIKNTGKAVDVDAQQALQPLVDKWVSLKDSALQGNRSLAKPFEEIYGKLTASAQNGRLSLDSLREALAETGQALSRAGDGSPKEAAYRELYGALAGVRERMVNSIAESVGNPSLAENLIKANAGYSKYVSLMPDIARKAAKEGTDKLSKAVTDFDISKPFKSLEIFQPALSKAAIKIGRVMKMPSAESAVPLAVAGKVMTEEKAREYMNKAGKDKEKARRMAREDGYKF